MVSHMARDTGVDRIDRRGAWWQLAGAGAVLLLLAGVLVPWQWTPGATLHPPSAADVFSTEQLRAAESHAQALRLLTWSSYAVSLVLAGVLGFTRLGSTLTRRLTGALRWWLAVPWAAFWLLLAGRVVTMPFGLLVRERNLRDGLTNQGLTGWLTDWALSLLVSWVLLSALLLLFIGLARRSPRRWFAWAGALLVGLTFFVSLLYPVLVEPLFNDFRPLKDGPFKESVLQLADDEGVEVSDVLVSDASRRTTTLNAYVSGFGSTRRIVLYDNLLADLTPDEARAIVAHELAHARHRDVVLGTGLGALGAVMGVAALALVLDDPRVRRRAGVRGPADPAAVALIAALVAVGGLLSSPAQNVVSRAIEARADVTALTTTHDPEAFRQVQRQLALRSLADPTPPWFGYVWFASHPTVLQRLAIADAVAQGDRG
jgi:STE24 endopeptidase